jgi:hypothetical protein
MNWIHLFIYLFIVSCCRPFGKEVGNHVSWVTASLTYVGKKSCVSDLSSALLLLSPKMNFFVVETSDEWI